MKIAPVSSAQPSTDRWSQLHDRTVLWAAQARAAKAAASKATSSDELPDTPELPEGVEVQVARHEGTGSRTFRFVEAESGDLLSQIPAEQVLDVVAGLLEMIASNDEGAADVER